MILHGRVQTSPRLTVRGNGMAGDMKIVSVNPAVGVELPKQVEKAAYHVRSIDEQKTLTMEQIQTLLEASRGTPIHMQILFNVLMGLRRQEINGLKYSDVDYICCSSYGRPRSKDFYWKHYKKLLKDNGLPDIRWHDLRSTFCTLLLKNDFSPKAVSKLMGHAKEIISVDVYGDNTNMIPDEIPELLEYMEDVLPEASKEDTDMLSDVVVDVSDYLKE